MERITDMVLIVPAAGASVRFGSDKMMSMLHGLPVYLHCIRTIAPLLAPGRVILAVAPARMEEFRTVTEQYLPGLNLLYVPGGSTRTESVCHALRKASELAGVKYAAVHDAARPFLTAELFTECVNACRVYGGALVCRRICDTVKRADASGCVEETLNREVLRAAETPQIFELSTLLNATEQALKSERVFTDDSQVMEYFTGVRPYLLEHHGDNRKITFAEDLNSII